LILLFVCSCFKRHVYDLKLKYGTLYFNFIYKVKIKKRYVLRLSTEI